MVFQFIFRIIVSQVRTKENELLINSTFEICFLYCSDSLNLFNDIFDGLDKRLRVILFLDYLQLKYWDSAESEPNDAQPHSMKPQISRAMHWCLVWYVVQLKETCENCEVQNKQLKNENHSWHLRVVIYSKKKVHTILPNLS